MLNAFFSKEKNNNYCYFFIVFWALISILFYFIFNGIPNFVCNDSFQYLSIAHDIYTDKKSTGLINYALDLYYDELALFKYDFNNLKPYHFPSYSAFLSLFYFIFDNHNFVIYFSQYLSYVIFSISTFLVISNYHQKRSAFFITLISFFCTSIIYYIADSGKETLCAGLAMLGIYLGMYYKKRNNFIIIISLSLIFTFLSITRNFYLLLSFLIFIFRALPTKYKEDEISETLKTKSIFFFFVFLIPLIAYIYCYYFIEIHLFIFDNRTDFYGGKSLHDLAIRIFTNFILGIFVFFVQYFQFFLDGLKIDGLGVLSHLYQTIGLSFIALSFYFKAEIKKFFITRDMRISKLFIINLFFLTLILAVITRFSVLGYRLTMGYLPIAFMIFYQQFFHKDCLKKLKYYKNPTLIFTIFFIIFSFIYNIYFMKEMHKNSSKREAVNAYAIKMIEQTNSKNIVASSNFFILSHLMPTSYQYPKDIYFLSSWREKYLCDDLANYHEHKIDFDIIFITNSEKCDFIDKNFYLKESNDYGFVYVKNSN